MGFKFDYANRFKLHPPKYRNIRKQLQDVWYCKVCFNIFCRWHRIFARLLWTIFDVLIQREIMDIIKGIHAWETGLQYSWTRNEYRHTLRCYYHLLYHEIYYVISSKCRSIYCTILPKCNRKWHLQYYIDMTSHKFVCRKA